MDDITIFIDVETIDFEELVEGDDECLWTIIQSDLEKN